METIAVVVGVSTGLVGILVGVYGWGRRSGRLEKAIEAQGIALQAHTESEMEQIGELKDTVKAIHGKVDQNSEDLAEIRGFIGRPRFTGS